MDIPALELGERRVIELMFFYRGADYQRYIDLMGRGRKRSQPASGELARITREYPIREFMAAAKEQSKRPDPDFDDAAMACVLAKEEAFRSAGVHD